MSRRGLQKTRMNVVSDEGGELMTDGVSLKRGWKIYLEELFEWNVPLALVPPQVIQEPETGCR